MCHVLLLQFSKHAVICAVLLAVFCSSTPDTWSALPPMPTKRYGQLAFVYNDVVYVIGGKKFSPTTPPTILRENEGYSISQDQWASYQDMPTARYYTLGTATYNSKFLFTAGRVSETSFRDKCEIYDAALDAWVTVATFPQVTSTLAMVAVNEMAYGFGGEPSPTSYTSNVYAYSFLADTWVGKRSLPSPGAYLGAAAVGPDIFVGGLTPLYRYSTTSDSYAVLASFPFYRGGFGAGTDGYSVFFVGGTSGPSTQVANEKYVIATDTWTTVTPAPVARMFAAAVAVGQSFYYFGGFYPGGSDMAYVYTLSGTTSTSTLGCSTFCLPPISLST